MFLKVGVPFNCFFSRARLTIKTECAHMNFTLDWPKKTGCTWAQPALIVTSPLMNHRTNELTNQKSNELTDKQMNESTNELMNEHIKLLESARFEGTS